jgi:hypothetical protein
MRSIIAAVAATAALGLATSVIPAQAQHHGGAMGHAGPSMGMGHAGPSMGVGRAGPSLGATSGAAPRAFSAPSNNFAPNRSFAAPNRATAFRDRDRGFRDRDHRRFRGFAFGGAPLFWGDYGYDYGADYAYDDDYGYGYGYDNGCFALRRVFYGGYWHTRRVWLCG